MATAKTGSFYLTETITLPAALANGSRVGGSIDTSAYVSVATGQALAVESVDFVVQRSGDYGAELGSFFTSGGNGSLSFQVTDLNPGGVFVRADNQSLIASGSLNVDGPNNIGTHTSDLYPDNFGPSAMSEAFLVVNDQLYLTGGNDGNAVGTGELYITARIKCRIVKLGNKDWMAIAIQSTASDN